MSTRRLATLTAAGLGAAALTLSGTTSAHADGLSGGSNGGGFTTSVTANISGGSGDPLTGGGGGSSISISVPPKCWWEPWNTSNLAFEEIDRNDPKAMKKWFEAMDDALYGGSFVAATLTHPSEAYINAHLGDQWTWYTLKSAEGVNCADEGFSDPGGMGPEGWAPGSGRIPVGYAAFPDGAPAPVLVDINDVVETVWDLATAEVEPADLDRNPQISTADGATLVNLDTWFWVQNVQEALANDGEINLRVEIPQATSATWAELTATTEGVQVTSPAGAVSCSVDQATTEWSNGAADGGGCSFPFDRANPAGWPVTSAINWTGTWQGMDSGGADGGPLAPISQTSTINVPVAESQALVNDVD